MPAKRTSRYQETRGWGRRTLLDWCRWVCGRGCWCLESWRAWRSLSLSPSRRWWWEVPRRGQPPDTTEDKGQTLRSCQTFCCSSYEGWSSRGQWALAPCRSTPLCHSELRIFHQTPVLPHRKSPKCWRVLWAGPGSNLQSGHFHKEACRISCTWRKDSPAKRKFSVARSITKRFVTRMAIFTYQDGCDDKRSVGHWVSYICWWILVVLC